MLHTELIQTVDRILRQQARLRADCIAFIDDERRVTYGELEATTARVAGHLQDLGLNRGDRVLLYLGNRVETAESYLAVPRAGCVAVCVNAHAAPAEVAHVLDDSGARVIITDAARLDVSRALAAGRDLSAVIVVDYAESEAGDRILSYTELLARPSSPPRDCLELDDAVRPDR